MTKVCDLPPLALSIRQPWVHCILELGKRIENRTWSTNIRGPICIHAAKGMKVSEFDDCMDFVDEILPLEGQMASNHRRAYALDACSIHRRGGIVATANLVDCIGDGSCSNWAATDNPWFMGRYGFVLTDVRPVDFIPVRGALGFFDWRKNLTEPVQKMHKFGGAA